MDEATQFSTKPWVERVLNDLQQGSVESIESSLPADPVKRLQCLEAYILADIRSKFTTGERVDQEDYLKAWPEINSDWLSQAIQCAADRDSAQLVSESVESPSVSHEPSQTSSKPHQWKSGSTIGQFVIGAKVGEGAHGTVFVANDTQLNRKVAIKVSPDSGIEGRILARLDHPNIVQIHGQFMSGAYRCLVMPLIQGPTFVDLLNQKPYQNTAKWNSQKLNDWVVEFVEDKHPIKSDGEPSIDDRRSTGSKSDAKQTTSYAVLISEWVLCIARALQHAHSRGVLHRDIKPSNVILDGDGSPKLMDFNVAAVDSARPDSGQPSFGGTLSYMSPEHMRAFETATGEEDVDTRSDMYSLGVVFIELLTGQKNWTNQAQLLGLLNGPSVPRTLIPVLLRCVQPEPVDRYQGAHELIRDLEAWLASRRLPHARPVNGLGLVTEWLRCNSKLLGAGAVLLAVVLGLIGVGSWRAETIIDRCDEMTEAAERQVQQGSLVEAYDTIGDAKGLIASAPAVRLLRPFDSEQLHERWDQLLRVGKAARLESDLETFRRSQLAFLRSSPTESTSSGIATESLAEYHLLFRDDWESRPPFASLNDQERIVASQQLTELVLLLGLQREQMTGAQRKKWKTVRNRLPLRYRSASAFRFLESADNDFHVGSMQTSSDGFENYLLGIALMDHGDFSAAREHFQASRMQASRTSKPRYWCLYWEALACQELGQLNEAAVLYGACLGQDAAYVLPYINLSLLHAESEELVLARRFIEEAVKTDPSSGLAHETRAAICLKQQDLKAARHSIAAAESIGYESENLSVYRSLCELE
ncbi:protein kinase domain-containing protein [Planctomycetaceae bacterium SH139]